MAAAPPAQGKRCKSTYTKIQNSGCPANHWTSTSWGSLLKQDSELSSFGQQVEAYADVYMRRVSCLRHYSPMQFFRSPHDLMPHEL